MSNQRHFPGLPALVIFCAIGTTSSTDLAADRPPNIVFIVADDLGIECLECYGGVSYKTPNLDKLAAAGRRFMNCFSNPLCSPSRAQLLTGRYPLHNGMRRVIHDPVKHTEFLDPQQETTFANLLKDKGYQTLIAGKWQVSMLSQVNPITDLGFEKHQCWLIAERDGSRHSRYHNPTFIRNGKRLQGELRGEYGPDLNCRFVTDFIRANRDRPFLAYYTMLLPHFPYESTPLSNDPLKASSSFKGDPKYFVDMVQYMDTLVGRVIAAINETELSEKTLIVFTGDNGTQQPLKSRFRRGKEVITVAGGKGSMTDAGTHVPLISCWPGKIEPGSVCQDLIDFSDFLPTFVELSGAAAPPRPLNGRSFAPQLFGKPGNPRAWVHAQNNDDRHVRSKEYILDNKGRIRPTVSIGDPPAKPLRDPLTPAQQQAKAELQQALETAQTFGEK